jgi:hypothetical protein
LHSTIRQGVNCGEKLFGAFRAICSGVSLQFKFFLLICRMGKARKRLLISVITLVLFSFGQAHAQQNYGSANYVLPLCKTWLKVVVETE